MILKFHFLDFVQWCKFDVRFFCLVGWFCFVWFFFPLTADDLDLTWYYYLNSRKIIFFYFPLNIFFKKSPKDPPPSLTDFFYKYQHSWFKRKQDEGIPRTIFNALELVVTALNKFAEWILISQSCKITSTHFHILLQLSKHFEEKVPLIVYVLLILS